ncbi:conserved phage C-terminal domain-containing protein [Tenacibaculum dicentrarchi]|uniref:conserved phage C-terminal domain-containing protein n=1 Tax=Tenacibaculum dicentrarchi TaxID=669041 RepID=UPI003512E772
MALKKQNSELVEYTKNNIANSKIYAKLDRRVILDTSLKPNDIAVYIAVLFEGNLYGEFVPISSEIISKVTDIKQQAIHRHTQKLEKLKYLEVKKGKGNNSNKYRIAPNPKQYLYLTVSETRVLMTNKKLYASRLKALFLSYGANKMPSFSKSNDLVTGNLTRHSYNIIAKTHNNFSSDIEIYKSLSNGLGIVAPIKGAIKEPINKDIEEAIVFLNKLYSRNFDYKSTSTINNLKEYLELHGLETIKKVIANRYETWKDDKIMAQNLTPKVIFSVNNFDCYLEDTKSTDKGARFLSIEENNIKEGEEITEAIASTFTDDEVYSMKVYRCDTNGNRIGNGVPRKSYGKDIKRMINIQQNNKKRGQQESIYIFDKQN